jgi:signal transduction histidine kinase
MINWNKVTGLPSSQNFSNNVREIREIERFIEAKSTLKSACIQASVLLFTCWPIDLFYLPNSKWLTLMIRILLVASCLAMYLLTERAQSGRTVQKYNLCFTCIISITLYSLIYISGMASSFYFGSLNVATIGTIVFMSWEKRFLPLVLLIIFAPFYITILIFGIPKNDYAFQIVNASLASNMIWLALVMRSFSEYFKLKEIESRVGLGIEIEKREYLIRLNTELEAKLIRDASLGAITNQVLHDLKSPLSALNILNSHREIPDKPKELLLAAYQRLNDILVQHGHESRTELNDLPSLNLRSSLNATYLETQYICTSKQIELIWIWPDLNQYFKIDHLNLSRALTNLVQNSINSLSSTKHRQLRIEISISNSSLPRELVILVKDSGKGITTETEDRIWTKGFSKTGSTGLGLSFVQSFATQHKGSIRLLKPIDQFSTCFQLSIPEAIKTHPVAG